MERRLSHITPRYVIDRLRVMMDERINPSHPWITAHAVSLLDQLIKPTDVGVEFGSGRSTAWFAKRLKHLTSIEHDYQWYKKVEETLLSSEILRNVDLLYFEDENDYAQQASKFADHSIDFVLVDGVLRDKCALWILPKIKTGGILVLDNCNWYLPNDSIRSPNSRRSCDGPLTDLWICFVNETEQYRGIWTTNGVSDTAIWFIA